MDRETELLIEGLRNEIRANDRRYSEAATADKEALRVALEAASRRLDSMNEFRGALSDANSRFATKVEVETSRSIFSDKLEQVRLFLDSRLVGDFEPLRAKVEAQSRPNWALLTSCLSIFLVVIAGAWLVMGLKIDGSIAPVALSVEQAKVAQASTGERVRLIESTQQVRSQAIADISSMKQDLQRTFDRVAEIRSDNTKQTAALIEIETQFCAADIMRNLMHAHDMRVQSLLWDKSFEGSKMPTDNAYYPVICNRSSLPTASGPVK